MYAGVSSEELRRRHLVSARSVVVKVGTGVLTLPGGRLNPQRIAGLASQIHALRQAGRSVVLVSSGAVGAGVGRLNLPARPSEPARLQAAAAVGQPLLMRAWDSAFAELGIPTAQVLVTRGDFADRTCYLNMINTFDALAGYGALPVLNENDTTADEELRFTDNDGLAALVAQMLAAEVLVLLTSVDGLLAPAGREGGGLEPLDVVPRITPEIRSLVGAEMTSLGRGGMGSKLDAVSRVTAGGSAVVIANGKRDGVIGAVFEGRAEGTLFLPTGDRDQARRRWIAQAAHPAGSLLVDAGAATAVRAGKSLLPSGCTGVEGRFARGDVVAVLDPERREVARGLANYDAADAVRIKGLRTDRIADVLGGKSYDELIHRDYLVVSAG